MMPERFFAAKDARSAKKYRKTGSQENRKRGKPESTRGSGEGCLDPICFGFISWLHPFLIS
jgi:hypothetical protein